jgi:hypothetical protein
MCGACSTYGEEESCLLLDIDSKDNIKIDLQKSEMEHELDWSGLG